MKFKIQIKNPSIPSQPQHESWSFLKDVDNRDFETDDVEILLNAYNAQARIHPEDNLIVVGEFEVKTIRSLVIDTIPTDPDDDDTNPDDNDDNPTYFGD